jgi:hypothetical protein
MIDLGRPRSMLPACFLMVCGLSLALPGRSLASRASDELSVPAGRLETQHFLVIHSATQAQVRTLSARLEVVYRVNIRLARELHVDLTIPAQKLNVVVYSQYADFRAGLRTAGLDESTLGYFDAARNRCVFFDFETHPDVVRLRQELDGLHANDWAKRKRLSAQMAASLASMNERIVQHEAAHMIQANIGLVPGGADVPPWLVEGLAELFELPFVERGASIALSVNRYRLHEFQQLHSGAEHRSDLRRMIAGEAWRGGPDYSLAWALTNYLYVRQRERFAAYVRLVTRPAVATAPASRLDQFESAFGPLDAEFAAGFEAYMSSLVGRHLSGHAVRPKEALP